jgi:hypothetical protein
MPKLPDSTDLSGARIAPARSFVNLPSLDIAGAANAVAQGVGQIGTSIENVQEDRRKKAAAQERFDTKMGLLKAEDAFAEQTRGLDPLDPGYVEKKRTIYKEVMAPVLTNVRDPENKQFFDLSTYEGFTSIGQRAADEHKTARGKKAELDVDFLTQARLRDVSTGADPEAVLAETFQTIDDNQDLDSLSKEVLKQKARLSIAQVGLETKATGMYGNLSGGAIVRAVVGAESSGDPKAVSPAGALGLMQVMPETAAEIAVELKDDEFLQLSPKERSDYLKRPDVSLRYGTYYLNKQLKKYNGDLEAALIAYNAGPGNADAWLKAGRDYDVLPKKEETQPYVQKIFSTLGVDAVSARANPKLLATADDVRASVKSDPLFKSLPVDEQDKLLTDIDTQMKKAEAVTTVQLQRDTVDYAVQKFEKPAEAEAYIKSTITDPKTREDTLLLYRKEQDQIAENKRREAEDRVNGTWDVVTQALDAGDTTAALAAARTADIPAKEREALLERIDKGRAVVDDPDTYNELQAQRLTSPSAFADRNLVELQGKLKPSTIDALAREQAAIKKQVADTGKVVSLETPAAMLDQRMRELEIDTSNKANAADLRAAREIRSIMAQNLDNAVKQKGSDLTPSEIDEVMDQTFMQFRGKKPGWFSSSDATFTLKDVTDKYIEEEQRLEMTDGALLDEALADFQSQGIDVTPARLDRWLKLKMDGAAK